MADRAERTRASLSWVCGLVALVLATSGVVVPAGGAGASPERPSAPVAVVPGGFSDTTVFSGLTQPTAVSFAADGRVFVAEKGGVIKVFDSLTDSTATVFADLRTQVHNFVDRGLLGLALHPQFPTRPYVYALYTYDAEPNGTAPRWGNPGATSDGCPNPPGATSDGCVVQARLSRLTASGDHMTGAEQPLVTGWCQQFPSHSVGTVAFGPDGYLYVSAGDGANYSYADYGQTKNPCGDPPSPAGTSLTAPAAEGGALRSQSPRRPSSQPRTLGGTIIRIDPLTGAGAPGNPFASSADQNARRIIAYGLRNPFRFGLRPGTDQLWLGDVGWRTWEEINRVADVNDTVAENFGWPCYEGTAAQPGYDTINLTRCESLYSGGGHTGPVHRYDHAAKVVAGDSCPTGSSSISGIAFESGSNYPAAYDGALFFADASRDCIWVMRRGSSGSPDPAQISQFVGGAGPVVQVLTGPGGDLFYVSLAGEVHRVSYNGANHPPTAVLDANPTSGPAPLAVSFDARGSSDLDAGETLSYAWDLDGDGQLDDATTATASHTYGANGTYTARVRVSDRAGASDTKSVTIVVGPLNTPPAPVIDAPTSAVRWRVGEPVLFSGRAADAQDGNLAGSRLSWSVVLNHCPSNCHQHPYQDFVATASGSFPAPDHEHPTTLTLVLTATDSAGATASTSVEIQPATVDLTFATNPAGLQLGIGPEQVTAPATRTAIVGSSNGVSAPYGQVVGGTGYAFDTWSDGGAATHNVVAPGTPASYTATYQPVQPGCPGTPSWFHTIPATPGPPAVAPTPGGRTVFATLGPDGNHYLTAGALGTAPPGAGPLECMGAGGTSHPAVVVGSGFVGLFARTADGRIWQRTLTPDSAGSWSRLPSGTTPSRPAAVVTGGNVVHLVMRGTDNRIYHATRRGTTWSGWDNLGGSMVGAPAVAPAPGGGVAIVTRGSDNRVHVRYGDTGLWTPWSTLGDLTTGTHPTVAWGFAAGQLDVFTTGAGGGLYHNVFIQGSNRWTGWTGRDAAVPAGATLAAVATPGRVLVYVQAGGATTTRQNSGPGWPPNPAPYTCATCVPTARTYEIFP